MLSFNYSFTHLFTNSVIHSLTDTYVRSAKRFFFIFQIKLSMTSFYMHDTSERNLCNLFLLFTQLVVMTVRKIVKGHWKEAKSFFLQ